MNGNHPLALACLAAGFLAGCRNDANASSGEVRRTVEEQRTIAADSAREVAEAGRKAAAFVVQPVTRQYETLERAFVQENARLSPSFEALGFVPPPDSSTFRFEKIRDGMAATLRQDLGDCRAGTVWKTLGSSKDGDASFRRSVGSPACEALTPNFVDKASR